LPPSTTVSPPPPRHLPHCLCSGTGRVYPPPPQNRTLAAEEEEMKLNEPARATGRAVEFQKEKMSGFTRSRPIIGWGPSGRLVKAHDRGSAHLKDWNALASARPNPAKRAHAQVIKGTSPTRTRPANESSPNWRKPARRNRSEHRRGIEAACHHIRYRLASRRLRVRSGDDAEELRAQRGGKRWRRTRSCSATRCRCRSTARCSSSPATASSSTSTRSHRTYPPALPRLCTADRAI
jgi:hypothetical protein